MSHSKFKALIGRNSKPTMIEQTAPEDIFDCALTCAATHLLERCNKKLVTNTRSHDTILIWEKGNCRKWDALCVQEFAFNGNSCCRIHSKMCSTDTVLTTDQCKAQEVPIPIVAAPKTEAISCGENHQQKNTTLTIVFNYLIILGLTI